MEMSGLGTHERFLCRLTVSPHLQGCGDDWTSKDHLQGCFCCCCVSFQISSLNLLRVISEQEGVPIEELNAGRVCDWFLKDKLKREQNVGTAVLQWDDPGF